MKELLRIMVLITTLALVITLAACGGSKQPTETLPAAPAVNETVEVAKATEIESTEAEKTIVVGLPITLDDVIITITQLSIVSDYEDNPALKISYDWTNNGDKATSPYMTFIIKGFQDSVETDRVLMSDDIDKGLGQKEVKPGGTISAETGILIADMNKPLLLELSELITFDDDAYTMTIEDLNSLQ